MNERPSADSGESDGNEDDTQEVAVPRPPVREFGRYEILEEISRGAMGIVYRAREKALGRIVALKVLLAGEHASSEQVGRFIREARAIARIRHPNIVPIHDVGEVDGRHYFTMDYIEGKPLSLMIAEGTVDIRRSLDIMESVADAAECAHAAGVIHRDIKPSNIMIDPEGRAQIMDFGLAKPVEDDTQYTRAGTTIGTPAYMPPEQARGEVSEITARSDVYSIGAVLYELVAGQTPFEGPSMLDIILDVLHSDPPRPRKLNARIHGDVETIILRAMEKEPERRYASAAALRDDIRRFKAGEAIHARPPSVLRHASRWARRHGMLLVWVATVLVGGGVFAMVVYDLSRRVGPPAITNPPPAQKYEQPVWNTVWEDPAPRSGEGTDWQERASFLEARELVPAAREPSLGSVRITATIQLAPGAGKREIAIGLLSTQEKSSPVPFYGVMGGGRIRLYGVADVEQSAVARRTLRDMRVLVERKAPPLRAGARYSVKFERRELDLKFQVAGDDGDLDETLVIRNIHLSNWRVKNLFPALGLRAGIKWSGFRLDELYSGKQDEFDVADGLFILGEYNGAKARYQAIVETGRPAPRVNAARLRLGMCAEIERRFDEAVVWYGGVAEDAAGTAIEAKLRESFCRLELARLEEAERAVGELGERTRALPEIWQRERPVWKWELANLAIALADAKRYPAAAGVIGLARPAPGWLRMEDAAVRAGKGLAGELRARELRALAGACPTADLAPALAVAVAKMAAKTPEESLNLLTFSRPRFGGREDVFAKAAVSLARSFVKTGEFAQVVRVHRAWPLEEVAAVFKDAVGDAIERKRYDHALDVLAYAHAQNPQHNNVLKGLSITLAKKLCAEERFGDVRRVHESYPDAALIVNFREAAAGLLAKGDLNGTVSLLGFARRSFGPGDKKLARIAGAVSRRFAAPGTADEALRLFVSIEAYPAPQHATHVRSGMQTLAMSGRPQQAMGLFALYRAQLPEGDEALTSQALAILEEVGDPQERDNAFRALDDVSGGLAYDRLAKARWLVELGDMACRVGGRRARADRHYGEALATVFPAARPVATIAAGRRAVLYETEGRSAVASVIWNDLATQRGVPRPLAEAAKLMSGRSTSKQLKAWRAKHAAEMSESEEAMYLGLAALQEGSPEDAAEAFARSRSAIRGLRWPYHVLERLEDMLPER